MAIVAVAILALALVAYHVRRQRTTSSRDKPGASRLTPNPTFLVGRPDHDAAGSGGAVTYAEVEDDHAHPVYTTASAPERPAYSTAAAPDQRVRASQRSATAPGVYAVRGAGGAAGSVPEVYGAIAPGRTPSRLNSATGPGIYSALGRQRSGSLTLTANPSYRYGSQDNQAASSDLVYAAASPQHEGGASGPAHVYAMPLAADQHNYAEVLAANTPEYSQATAAASQTVAPSKGSGSALWMHGVDRPGAEAILRAATAHGDPSTVRYLVRPKGGGYVLSLLDPSIHRSTKPRFIHDFVVARGDGQFSIQGRTGGSIIGVASRVAEAIAKNVGGAGSAPVLHGASNRGAEFDGGTAC